MNIFHVFLLSSLLLGGPEEPKSDRISFNLDAPAVDTVASTNAAKLETEPDQEGKAKPAGFFESVEAERRKLKEQLEYDQALAAMEKQKAEAEHRALVESQSKAFSKAFLSMDTLSPDFPTKFHDLVVLYPLAAEDTFCARLMDKGRRVVAARTAVTAEAQPK